MATDHRAQQREALDKALIQFARQYEAALMQSVNTIDARARVQADQQADDIATRMAALEEKRRLLDLTPPAPHCPADPGRDPARVHDLLKAHLHKIDFRQVAKAIRDLLDGDAEGGRAGLLCFQRCGEMHGRLCAERVLNLLKAETESGNFRHLQVEFRPADRNDPLALLRLVAADLGLDLAGVPPAAQVPMVARALCASLQPGSILLLDIGRCDYLPDRAGFLRWVVEDLWRSLLAELEHAARPLPGAVTLVGLLFFDCEVESEALAQDYCCSPAAVRRDRLLEIELRHWQHGEVMDWLTHWGGLGAYPGDEVRLLAETIMKATLGIPALIANELLGRCAALRPLTPAG